MSTTIGDHPPDQTDARNALMARLAPSDEARANTVARLAPLLDCLLDAPLHGDVFQRGTESILRLGRREMTAAADLLAGRVMARNTRGIEAGAAFAAIATLRTYLDQLDPARQGDLFGRRKLFGILPMGNRLQAYFRRFQAEAARLQAALQAIYNARDDMLRDELEIEGIRAKLWQAILLLADELRLIEQLSGQLAGRLDELAHRDAPRSRVLREEVLYGLGQNLQDMQTQQAINLNGYLVMEVLKRGCREMIAGCDRVATTGLSALAVAQTVARASGNQLAVMALLEGVDAGVSALRDAPSGKPELDMAKLQAMFQLSFEAMDALAHSHADAMSVLAGNKAAFTARIAQDVPRAHPV
ncbi:toxic anion resistance protein [Chitinimonas arctica]|uniref:Toxic anion resistance protein n=1 Tax=Chitinimonas arctica TaxID=2594795 RepID=A0A516SDC7_9NEIS|nr:toxic anion resistance protein [Chitinimonas arctica]QDQ26144.1 toxic anion resistance protein [Chitinimonas arctica]